MKKMTAVALALLALAPAYASQPERVFVNSTKSEADWQKFEKDFLIQADGTSYYKDGRFPAAVLGTVTCQVMGVNRKKIPKDRLPECVDAFNRENGIELGAQFTKPEFVDRAQNAGFYAPLMLAQAPTAPSGAATSGTGAMPAPAASPAAPPDSVLQRMTAQLQKDVEAISTGRASDRAEFQKLQTEISNLRVQLEAVNRAADKANATASGNTAAAAEAATKAVQAKLDKLDKLETAVGKLASRPVYNPSDLTNLQQQFGEQKRLSEDAIASLRQQLPGMIDSQVDQKLKDYNAGLQRQLETLSGALGVNKYWLIAAFALCGLALCGVGYTMIVHPRKIKAVADKSNADLQKAEEGLKTFVSAQLTQQGVASQELEGRLRSRLTGLERAQAELGQTVAQLERRSDEHHEDIGVLKEQARAKNGLVTPRSDLLSQVSTLGVGDRYLAQVEVVVDGEPVTFVVPIIFREVNGRGERLYEVGLVNPIQSNLVKHSELRATLLRGGGKEDGTGLRYNKRDFGDTVSPAAAEVQLLEPPESGTLPLLSRLPAPEEPAAVSGDGAAELKGQQPVAAIVAPVTPPQAAGTEPVVLDPAVQANMAALVANAMPEVVVPTAPLDRSADRPAPTSFGKSASVIVPPREPLARGHASTVYRGGERQSLAGQATNK